MYNFVLGNGQWNVFNIKSLGLCFSKLVKPLEMALFFSCDKWYSYCIITSNFCSHMLLKQLRKSTPVVSALRASGLRQCHLWLFFRIHLWWQNYWWKVRQWLFTVKTYVMKLNWCQFSQQTFYHEKQAGL